MAEQRLITVAGVALAEFTEKKSRFIGQIAPAAAEAEALAFLEQVRERHKGANHHCYAWQIGADDQFQRSADAGEPAGTAGRPILEAIKRAGLHNTVIVVTRFFGGILLGAGGLTRAYGRAAAMAVGAAGVVTAENSVRLSMRLPYPRWDKVSYALSRLPVLQTEQEFGADVAARFVAREKDLSVVLKELAVLTEGEAKPEISSPFYALWPQEASPG